MNEMTGNNSTTVFRKPSQLKEIWRMFKKNKSAIIGLTIIVLLLLIGIFADVIVPYEMSIKQNISQRMQRPSTNHLLGTDAFGRDLFARCVHGARVSLGIGITATVLSMVAGVFLGAMTAYYGGYFDEILMRFMDILRAVPTILMALSIVAALGSSIPNLIIAITITRTPFFIRIVRSTVMPIVHQDYIKAAYAGGTRDIRVILKHILPNAVGPIMVQTTMSISLVVLQVSSLSFLGLGVNPPTPEWGAIISSSREFLRQAPYMMFSPGILIILTALSFNLVGDGLRDALDPRLKS